MMSDAVIERLNLWGDHCARIAWPLLWQSSLLIVGVFIADFFLRRKIRPSVRQALWFVVLVKLLLPPSFAIPTGIGWWLRPREVAPAKPKPASYIVTYGSFHAPSISRPEEAPSSFIPVLPPFRLSASARALLASAAISATLLIIMLVRWRHLRHQLRLSDSPPIWLQKIVGDARSRARCRRPVRLSLTDATISPALCGLFRPVILLPKALVKKLTPPQLRAVLLHELFHLRNGDVWINCFQSLLQIVFWWHPFLWLANARIRRIREEVVDDSVRLALAEEAETYAPTLLEVARLALARPLATLGLVGILESRHALKQRVDRLVNFPAPRRVGLSVISVFAILAFASVALPMGQAPAKSSTPTPREAPTVYYSFDQGSLDYFGSNGVDAVNHAPAQNSDVSNPSQNEAKALGFDYYLGNVLMKNGSMATNSSERLLDSRGLDMQAGLPIFQGSKNAIFKNAIFGEPGFGAVASTPLGLQLLTDNGWVDPKARDWEAFYVGQGGVRIHAFNRAVVSEFNVATGIATATNRAVLSGGDTSLSADNITVNRETGEIVAEGSVQLKKGAYIPLVGKFHGNITNRLFAQNQPSVIGSSRIPQAASGKRRIMNKLEAIRLNHVAFDNLPLSEVVNYLQAEAKKRDPEGKGINFILNPNADLAGAAGPPAIDPATGLQVTPPQVEPADINGVAVRISPPLEDVRMLDVLDAITKVADKRIRYSIGDYGVTFRLAGNNEPVQLFTRVIKVDPNAFAQGLESVVGFSVGNFPTGGQGGGGQGNSSGVTVPRVQFAPNGIGGQGGAQGGAGGISGVTRPITRTNQEVARQQAVKQFFANAGVDLTPPKNVFFNDRAGDLLVHATLNDFDIIEKALVALNAGSLLPSTSTARPATPSVTETSSKPALPQTNLAKVPLGDLPVVGKALTRAVEVSAANSPQQIPNANASNTEKLLFETIGAGDPIVFSKWVKKTAGLGDNANSQERMDAFRKILLDRGLQLAPPANVIYNERNGILFVRAIRPEIDVIEQIVQEVNRSSAQISPQANPPNPVPQVNIQARFLEVSDDETNLITINSDTNGPALAVLTDPQFRVVLHALEQRDGADLIAEHNVTTVSGRQAQIQNAEVQSIVKLNPQALVPPGVASSNALLTETLYSGPLIDIIPYVTEGGDRIQLTITATVTEFVGYDPPPENSEAVTVYLDGQATTIKRPHPHTRVRTMQAAVNLYDGQTVMLGRPKDEMIMLDKDGKALSTPSTSKRNLLVFVTATLIDAAGNPVHSLGSPASSTPGH